MEEKLMGSGEIDESVHEASLKTHLLNLDDDSLVHCLTRLSLRTLIHVAATCRQLHRVAYAEPIWEAQCRQVWPSRLTRTGELYQYVGGRDAFLKRHLACQQLRFKDPAVCQWSLASSASISHLLLGKEDNTLIVAQGGSVSVWDLDFSAGVPTRRQLYEDHKARITALRLTGRPPPPPPPAAAAAAAAAASLAALLWLRVFPAEAVAAGKGALVGLGGAVLVSGSADHTIRVWGKNRSLRTFQGHVGPVTALADRPLGARGSPPVLASGGSDCTVRLWALAGGAKGKSPRLGTLHGHETPVTALAVAGHNPALLVSAARDRKIRVWDTADGAHRATCVGSLRISQQPLSLHCEGATCYVAGGDRVTAVDLRSMRQVAVVAVHPSPGAPPARILVAGAAPAGDILCTGGSDGKARLWDLKANSTGDRVEPIAILSGHTGPVLHCHVDSYKVVTASLCDPVVRIWNPKSGSQLSSLDVRGDKADRPDKVVVHGLTSQGARLAIGFEDLEGCHLRVLDFSNCLDEIELEEDVMDMERRDGGNKFWQTYPEEEDCS